MSEIPKCQLPANTSSALTSTAQRGRTLWAPDLQRYSPGSTLHRENIYNTIEALNVEESPRYKPLTIGHSTQTWCNKYGSDFPWLFGCYLPLVFWTKKTIREKAFTNIPSIYNENRVLDNCYELTANDQYDWLHEYGEAFGWKKCDSLEQAQRLANGGSFVVLVGKFPGGIGHITIIIPEWEEKGHVAVREKNGSLIVPLQSEAGWRNKKYSQNDWMHWDDFRGNITAFWHL